MWRTTHLLSFAGLIAGLSLSGCITPNSSDKGDDGGTDPFEGDGDTVTIMDIQRGDIPEDSLVTIKGVLISSPLTADGDAFFIQDPAGGEYSGLYVYLQGSFTDLYLSVGDELTISGTVTEYYDFTEFTVSSMDDIEITGEGTLPSTVVDPAAVTDWEPYESVLITVEDATVLDCPNNFGEVELDSGLFLDDLIYTYDVGRDDHFDSITAPLIYNFEEWKMVPRDSGDFVGLTAGSGCTSTIVDIQQSGVTGGLQLVDVVATSGLTYKQEGFFVQDQGGGPWSGIYVYLGYLDDPSVIEVQRGDLLTLKGSVSEYYDYTEFSLSDASDLEITGTATAVATSLSSVPDDWEEHESCLITLEDATVTSAPSTYNEVDLDWGIAMDDLIYDHGASNGTTYTELTGLLYYSYEAWKICPAQAEDVAGGTGGTPSDATVYDIQTGAASGTVTLTSVVATTALTESGEGFFVQDAGGGDYAGIYVYVGSTASVPSVGIGDVMDLKGSVDEFYDFTELKVTDAANISITGWSAITSTQLTEEPSDWEPYEGQLVTWQDVSVTASADYGEFETSWGPNIDDLLYDTQPAIGAYSEITGVMYYTYSEWKFLPRNGDDFLQ